jgi:hypothetical protein
VNDFSIVLNGSLNKFPALPKGLKFIGLNGL